MLEAANKRRKAMYMNRIIFLIMRLLTPNVGITGG